MTKQTVTVGCIIAVSFVVSDLLINHWLPAHISLNPYVDDLLFIPIYLLISFSLMVIFRVPLHIRFPKR